MLYINAIFLYFIYIEMYALEFRKAVVQLYYFFNSMRKTSQALKISIPSIRRWTKNINPKNIIVK